MDDSLIVRGGKTLNDLCSVVRALAQRNGLSPKTLAEALALQQLADDKWRAIVFSNKIDGKNVGMTQRSGGLSFLSKTPKAIGVLRSARMQDL
jgi:hypothetical protein